jgi:GcrA cell cycle regulator
VKTRGRPVGALSRSTYDKAPAIKAFIEAGGKRYQAIQKFRVTNTTLIKILGPAKNDNIVPSAQDNEIKAFIEEGGKRTHAIRKFNIGWYRLIRLCGYDPNYAGRPQFTPRCSPPGGKIKWTPELVRELIQDWQAGISITKIARKHGINRNHVVGKAHRLGLPGRPSPIKRISADG